MIRKPHLSRLLTGSLLFAAMSCSAQTLMPMCNGGLSPAEPCKGNPAAQAARKAVVEQLYQSLVAPTPQEILNHTPTGEQIVASIFETAPNVTIKGRVTPAGKYEGVIGAEEYFWGLAGNIFSGVSYVNVKSLIASDDKVSVDAEINFCLPGVDCSSFPIPYGRIEQNGQLVAYTLAQTGLYTFNKNNRVIKYDLNIQNLGAISPSASVEQICAYLILPPAVTGIPNSGNCPEFWNRQNQYPTTVNGQPISFSYQGGTDVFSAFQNCQIFMNTFIPQGTWYRANSNTHVCRQLHMLLTPYRKMHCGHSGPKGLDVMPVLDANGNPVLDQDGFPEYMEMEGKCVDFPYESYFNEGF